MSSQKRQRIRLAVDIASQGTLIDLISGNVAQFTRGADIQLELGFFNNGALLDITAWATITASLKDVNGIDGNNLARATIGSAGTLPEGGAAWNTGLTLNNWNAGTDQHCVVIFPASSTTFAMTSSTQFLWLVIAAGCTLVNHPGSATIAADGTGNNAIATFVATVDTSVDLGDGITVTGLTGTGAASFNVTGAAISAIATNRLTITYPISPAVAPSLAATGTPTISLTLATIQQVGYGQATILDTGIILPAPTTVSVPIYLTESQGDARYAQTVDLSSINTSIATFTSNFTTLGSLVALSTLAPKASPTFTGTVTLPTQTNTVAALKLPSGTLLTTPVAGAIEFDGTNLYFTKTSGPTRITLVSSATLSSYATIAAPAFTGGVTVSTGNLTISAASAYIILPQTTPQTTIGASSVEVPSIGWAYGYFLRINGGTLTGTLNLAAAANTTTGNITISGNSSPAASQYWTTVAVQAVVGGIAQGSIAVNTIQALSAAVNNSTTFYQTVMLLTGSNTMTGDLKLAYTTTLPGGSSSASAVSLGYLGANYLAIAGSSTTVTTNTNFTGTLSCATPISSGQAANKSYVDGAIAGLSFLSSSGGTLTGGLIFTGTSYAAITLNSLTTSQVNSISSPVVGMLAYNNSLGKVQVYQASAWGSLGSVWYNGSSSASGGANGDYYLNTTTGIVSFNTAGTWAAVYTPSFVSSAGAGVVSSATASVTSYSDYTSGTTTYSVNNVALITKGSIVCARNGSSAWDESTPAIRIEVGNASQHWHITTVYDSSGAGGYSLYFNQGGATAFKFGGINSTTGQSNFVAAGDISGVNLLASSNATITGVVTAADYNTPSGVYKVAGTQVVSSRQTVSLSGGGSASGWSDSTAQNDFNNLFNALVNHGLVTT